MKRIVGGGWSKTLWRHSFPFSFLKDLRAALRAPPRIIFSSRSPTRSLFFLLITLRSFVMASAAGRTVFITGGNRGLRFHCARLLLLKTEYDVIIGSRTLDHGLKSVENLEAELGSSKTRSRLAAVQLDVNDQASIDAAVSEVSAKVGADGLSVLINNAGILVEDSSPCSVTSALETNFEGVVRVTKAFKSVLVAGSTCLTTSSSGGTRFMASLDEADSSILLSENLTLDGLRERVVAVGARISDPSHPYCKLSTPAYNLSKCAVNCFIQILSRERPDLIACCVSPGFTRTGMCDNYTGSREPKSPELGATVFLEALKAGKTGLFFKQNSKPGCDIEDAETVVTEWCT